MKRAASATALVLSAFTFGSAQNNLSVSGTVFALPLPKPDAPRVIGVNDFAFKRGHAYGTVIVNLETHRVLDLLPDRSSPGG